MVSTTLLIVLVAVSNTLAYNFQNSYFNHELHAVLKAVHGPRVARQAAEQGVCQGSFLSCCGKNTFDKALIEQMPLMVQCALDLNATNMYPNNTDPFSCEAIQKQQKFAICLSDCVAKKMNVMDENGNLKEAEMREITKKHLSEDWQKQEADKALTICMEQINKLSPGTAAGQHECSLKPLKLSECVWKEMQKNCPEDKKSKDTICIYLFTAMNQKQQ